MHKILKFENRSNHISRSRRNTVRITYKVYGVEERHSVFDFAEVQNEFQSFCIVLRYRPNYYANTVGSMKRLKYYHYYSICCTWSRYYIKRCPCIKGFVIIFFFFTSNLHKRLKNIL